MAEGLGPLFAAVPPAACRTRTRSIAMRTPPQARRVCLRDGCKERDASLHPAV
jgi:hypothetical protein